MFAAAKFIYMVFYLNFRSLKVFWLYIGCKH
jgi:hypothetical protein